MRRISVLMIFHVSNGWEDACRLFKKKKKEPKPEVSATSSVS